MKAHEDKQNFCFWYLSISTTHLEPTLWVTWGPRKPRTCGLANRYAYSTWGKYVVSVSVLKLKSNLCLLLCSVLALSVHKMQQHLCSLFLHYQMALCVWVHWLPSSLVSHHTSALCASCFWLLSASDRGKPFAFGAFGMTRWPDFNENKDLPVGLPLLKLFTLR